MSLLKRIGETVQSLGLAMYAFLILGILGMASCCTIGAIWGLVSGALGDEYELTPGTELLPGQLSVLWRMGVLPEGTRPEVYHDATRLGDGSAGCLVREGDLIRWQLGQAPQSLPISGATVRVTDTPSVVLVQGGTELECVFYALPGRDRFARMLESEAARAPAATP